MYKSKSIYPESCKQEKYASMNKKNSTKNKHLKLFLYSIKLFKNQNNFLKHNMNNLVICPQFNVSFDISRQTRSYFMSIRYDFLLFVQLVYLSA